MAVQRFFDKQLQIYRLKGSNLNNKTTFQSTATVEGALQNRQITEQSTQGIITSRKWVAYVDPTDVINKGDQLHYGGKVFEVTDVVNKDYGANQFLELDLREVNE